MRKIALQVMEVWGKREEYFLVHPLLHTPHLRFLWISCLLHCENKEAVNSLFICHYLKHFEDWALNDMKPKNNVVEMYHLCNYKISVFLHLKNIWRFDSWSRHKSRDIQILEWVYTRHLLYSPTNDHYYFLG